MMSDFKSILRDLEALHTAKEADYGDKNLYACGSVGVPATTGVAIRMNDKMARLNNIIRTGKTRVKSESLKDTLKDLAVYSIKMILMLQPTKEGDK